MGDWIPIEERLPEAGKEVLVFCKYDNAPLIAHHDGKVWYEKCDNIDIKGDAYVSTKIHKIDIGDVGYQVTHWQYLPDIPV